ncbi:GDP/GTP exchange factor for ARF, partial [Cladochytrium tenue]
ATPAAAFYLELLVRVATHNRDRVACLWPQLRAHLDACLAAGAAAAAATPGSATAPSAVLLDRAVSANFRLLARLANRADDADDALVAPGIPPLLARLAATPSSDLRPALPAVASGLQALAMALASATPPPPTSPHSSTASTSVPAAATARAPAAALVAPESRTHLLRLLAAAAAVPDAAAPAFDATCALLADAGAGGAGGGLVAEDSLGDCVDLLVAFAAPAASSTPTESPSARRQAATPVIPKSAVSQAATERALKTLERVYLLHTRIPALVAKTGMKSERIWFELWLPILSGLGQQCIHPSRDVRQHALTLLRRALLSPELAAGVPAAVAAPDAIESVLLPLADALESQHRQLARHARQLLLQQQQLQAYGGAAAGSQDAAAQLTALDETRARVAALLCRAFLHWLPSLVGRPPSATGSAPASPPPGAAAFAPLFSLWDRVADDDAPSDALREGVLESLKNTLLVMSTMPGVFAPPAEAAAAPGGAGTEEGAGAGVNLWDATWARLDPVLTGLREELFGGPAPVGAGEAAA